MKMDLHLLSWIHNSAVSVDLFNVQWINWRKQTLYCIDDFTSSSYRTSEADPFREGTFFHFQTWQPKLEPRGTKIAKFLLTFSLIKIKPTRYLWGTPVHPTVRTTWRICTHLEVGKEIAENSLFFDKNQTKKPETIFTPRAWKIHVKRSTRNATQMWKYGG